MEAIDLLTVPQVSAHFKSATALCAEAGPSFPDIQLEPVAVLGLSDDRKLVLSDPVVAVKRDGQLVCLWSQRTARERLVASEASRSPSPISRKSARSVSPDSVKRIPSLSSLASGGRVSQAGLTAALADLREENSRLKLEMSSRETEAPPADELRSLRRRLMTLEQRVSVERGLLARRMKELDQRETNLNDREVSVARKERLSSLSIPVPSPTAKPAFNRPMSASNVNVRRRSNHAWR